MNRTDKYLQQVADFRDAVGLPMNSLDGCDYETHQKVTLEELVEAADGLTNSIVTLAGIALDAPVKQSSAAAAVIDRIHNAMVHIGFKPDECMDIVHDANMSKLCKPEEVKATVDHYSMLGIESEPRITDSGLIAVYCAKTETGKDGKFYPAKKLLKCINWHEPDWSDLDQWMESDLVELFK